MSETKKFISASIAPGNVKAKIEKIELKEFYYRETLTTNLILHIETEPIPGQFKGFPKNQNDPNGPRHLGQIGRVRYNEFGFRDWVTPTGDKVTSESDMLRALKSLCAEIGQLKWFQDQDDKLPTAQMLVDKINEDELFKDFYLYFCIGSKQYVNKRNYVADDLFMPKYSKERGKPFSRKVDDLMTFAPALHVYKPKEKQ